MEYSSSMEVDYQRKHFLKSALMMTDNIVSGVKTIYKGMFHGTEKCSMEGDKMTCDPYLTPLEIMCSTQKDIGGNDDHQNVIGVSADVLIEDSSKTAQIEKPEQGNSSNQPKMDSLVHSETSLVADVMELSKQRRDTSQFLTKESVEDSFWAKDSDIYSWFGNSLSTEPEGSDVLKTDGSDDSNCSFRTAVSDLDSLDLCAVSEVGDSPSLSQFAKRNNQERSWTLRRFCNQQENCLVESTNKNSQQYPCNSFNEKGQSTKPSEESDVNALNSLNTSPCERNFSFPDGDFEFCEQKNNMVQNCSTPTVRDVKVHAVIKSLFAGELSTISKSDKTCNAEANFMEDVSLRKLGNSFVQFGPKRFKTIENKISSAEGNKTAKYVTFSDQHHDSDSAVETACDEYGKTVLHSTFSTHNSDQMKGKLVDHFPDYTRISRSGRSNGKRRKLNENDEINLPENILRPETATKQPYEKTFRDDNFENNDLKIEDQKPFKSKISSTVATEKCNMERGVKNPSIYFNAIHESPVKLLKSQDPLFSEENFRSDNQSEVISSNDSINQNIASAECKSNSKRNEGEFISDIEKIGNKLNESKSILHVHETSILSDSPNLLESMSIQTRCIQQLDFQGEPESTDRESKCSTTDCESKDTVSRKSKTGRKRRKPNRTCSVKEKRKRTQEWNIARGSASNPTSGTNTGVVKPLILFRPPRVFKTKPPPVKIERKTSEVGTRREVSPTCSKTMQDSLEADQSKTSPFPLVADNVKRVFELISPRCWSAPIGEEAAFERRKESFTSTDDGDSGPTETGHRHRSAPPHEAGPRVSEDLDKCESGSEVSSSGCRIHSIARASKRSAKTKALSQMKEQLVKRTRQRRAGKPKSNDTSEEVSVEMET